jgi:hypothetical protein
MTDSPKTSRLRKVWNWVDFWSRLDPPELVSEEQKARIREEIRKMSPETRSFLTDVWVRQDANFFQDLESIRRRGSSLLAATGVITGVVTLLVPIAAFIHASISPTSFTARALLGLTALAFFVIIYCAAGTVILAIRSQQVDYWGQTELKPVADRSTVGYELLYASSLYITYTDNVSRLRSPAGYLRQAQSYFRVLVLALASLVVASVLASAAGALTVPRGSQPATTVSSSPAGPASHSRQP